MSGMKRWYNKIAVVTGASAGIGAATCKALVEQGMIVVGLARRVEKMEKQTRPLIAKEYQKNFHCYKCDVGCEENVKEAFAWIIQTFGAVDVLINNAGLSPIITLLAMDNTQKVKEVMDTNVLGVVWCTREAFRNMKERSFDGHIIIVNSVSGHGVPIIPGYSFNIYGPSKHAVTAMTEVLRQEFQSQDTKIKITSVSPGCVRTEIAGNIELPADLAVLESEDVADAIVYCLQTPPHVQIHEMIIKPMGEKI
ncbi:farnesol dehydrogenase-like [Haematobia irritans]|uniref:farnesol dehydrogenase-like n=1 Tax=Haematobia irritans TaxID=7368 RepID=UPI003F50942B